MTRERPARSGEPVDWAFAAAAVALVFLAQLPFVRHQAVLLDEGVILQMAVDITQGKAPYRDGVHYAFPGVFYLTAAVFDLFGPSVDAARILAAAIFSVAAGAMVLMCRWWCSRGETALFVLLLLAYRVWAFPHWHMLNYSPLAVAMSLAAAWAAGEHIARRGVAWAILAGTLCGLAILAKQDSGGATALALGVAMLALGGERGRRLQLRSAIAFSAAVVAVVGGCLAAVWQAGFLADLWREAVYGPLYGVTHYQYLGRPAVFPLLAQDAHLRQNTFSYFPQIFMEAYGARLFQSALYRDTAAVDVAVKLIYHAPWMLALAGAAAAAIHTLRGARSVALQRRILALLLAAAFLLAFNPPHDWIHLLVLYPPTLLLVACALPLLRRRPAARTVIAAASLALFAASAHLAVEFRRRHSEAVHTPRGTFYTRPAIAGGFRAVLDAIAETPANTPLLAYPYHPFLNFLGDRPALSRYLFLWPVEWNEERDNEIIAALEARPDSTVLYSLSQLIHLGSPRDFATVLYRYLTDNYVIDRQYGVANPGLSFLHLRREPTAAAGSLRPVVLRDSRVTRQPQDSVAVAEDRETFVRIVDWPFHETIVLRTQPAAEVALRVPITPRPGDRLRTGYATNPEHWEHVFYPAARFRLAIADSSGETTVEERQVSTGPNPQDRRWFEVDIDLSPWAGRDVDVVLGISTVAGTFPRDDLAGWKMPRIHPAPTAPPARGDAATAGADLPVAGADR